jgi:LDH2 family malate/lactate/ureidoglycolate dehydrogenase
MPYPKKKEARYINSPEAITYNNESFIKTEARNQAISEMTEEILKRAEEKEIMRVMYVGKENYYKNYDNEMHGEMDMFHYIAQAIHTHLTEGLEK